MNPQQWLTPLQVAEYLGVSRFTIFRWIKDGTIAEEYVAKLTSRTIRIKAAVIDKLLSPRN